MPVKTKNKPEKPEGKTRGRKVVSEEQGARIGARIKKAREKRELNTEEFSEKLGITRQALNALERGRTYPSAHTLVQMREIFNISADYILCGPQKK